MEGAEQDRGLVRDASGNQFALVIEGTPPEIHTLLTRAASAVEREGG